MLLPACKCAYMICLVRGCCSLSGTSGVVLCRIMEDPDWATSSKTWPGWPSDQERVVRIEREVKAKKEAGEEPAADPGEGDAEVRTVD